MKNFLCILLLMTANNTFATTAAPKCSDFSKILAQSKPKDPTRNLTETEISIIKVIDSEVYEPNGSKEPIVVIDVDNDGKEDMVVIEINGSGRYVQVDAYELPTAQTTKLIRKFSASLGILTPPRFINIRGINYVTTTEDGITDKPTVYQLLKLTNEKYLKQTICQKQIQLLAATKCIHVACNRLTHRIKSRKENELFINFEWLQIGVAPAGLAIFFAPLDDYGDFDNTKRPTTIWRLGEKDYTYGHTNWYALGLGELEPETGFSTSLNSKKYIRRYVLPGDKHARLERTLTQQSAVLSTKLNKNISLPQQGQFFLFSTSNRTYWAWDFAQQPFGEKIHITYTNADKSDYIGMVQITRKSVLIPCINQCTNFVDH